MDPSQGQIRACEPPRKKTAKRPRVKRKKVKRPEIRRLRSPGYNKVKNSVIFLRLKSSKEMLTDKQESEASLDFLDFFGFFFQKFGLTSGTRREAAPLFGASTKRVDKTLALWLPPHCEESALLAEA